MAVRDDHTNKTAHPLVRSGKLTLFRRGQYLGAYTTYMVSICTGSVDGDTVRPWRVSVKWKLSVNLRTTENFYIKSNEFKLHFCINKTQLVYIIKNLTICGFFWFFKLH